MQKLMKQTNKKDVDHKDDHKFNNQIRIILLLFLLWNIVERGSLICVGVSI